MSTTRRIERILRETIDDLPAPLARALRKHGATVEILPHPPDELPDAFGSYQGSTFEEIESTGVPLTFPPRIEIYRSTFEGYDEEEIRTTLVHEIGHYLGIPEEELP